MAFIRVGDMLKASYDPDADGRIALPNLEPAVASEAEVDSRISAHETGARHRWTLDKLRKGAGLEADPVEIDVPVVDFPMKQKPAIVRWVVPGWWGIGTMAVTLVAGRIYYIPIFVSETTTYIRIGCEVDTASAGLADLRIFNWVNGLPGSLVLAAGTVDTGTTGIKEIIISQQLTRGYYFLALRGDATPHLRGFNWFNAMRIPVEGSSPTLSPAVRQAILTVDAAYADPAPTPTGAENVSFSTVILREN